MSEMLVIVGVALLVFGPTELPQIAKKIARGVRDIRRASDDLRRSIDIDDDDDQVRPRRGPLEAPPSITGSALNGDSPDTVISDTGAPSIVPVNAVAVGSTDDAESAANSDTGGDVAALSAASTGSAEHRGG